MLDQMRFLVRTYVGGAIAALAAVVIGLLWLL